METLMDTGMRLDLENEPSSQGLSIKAAFKKCLTARIVN